MDEESHLAFVIWRSMVCSKNISKTEKRVNTRFISNFSIPTSLNGLVGLDVMLLTSLSPIDAIVVMIAHNDIHRRRLVAASFVRRSGHTNSSVAAIAPLDSLFPSRCSGG